MLPKNNIEHYTNYMIPPTAYLDRDALNQCRHTRTASIAMRPVCNIHDLLCGHCVPGRRTCHFIEHD